MTDDRFTELLNGPLNHPRTAFFMLRLANALRSVVQRCGEAGDAALEAHCKELNELYHMRDEPFTDEEAGRAIYESMRRGGSEPV